jgi:hypothetical protein
MANRHVPGNKIARPRPKDTTYRPNFNKLGENKGGKRPIRLVWVDVSTNKRRSNIVDMVQMLNIAAQVVQGIGTYTNVELPLRQRFTQSKVPFDGTKMVRDYSHNGKEFGGAGAVVMLVSAAPHDMAKFVNNHAVIERCEIGDTTRVGVIGQGAGDEKVRTMAKALGRARPDDNNVTKQERDGMFFIVG